MKHFLFSSRFLTLGLATAILAGVVAPTASADTFSCQNPLLSQPFLAYGDTGWYTLIPGETPGNVNGAGWTLRGGARLVTTTLANGDVGSVLDLPPGSSATTPIMCVESGMPLARMITRMAAGPTSNATAFQVWSANGTTIGGAMPVLGKTSWTLSPPVNIVPGSFLGWKQVYFTFTAKSPTGDLQLYNLYVDPRMR